MFGMMAERCPPFLDRNRRKSWEWLRLSPVLSPIFRPSEPDPELFFGLRN